jgi:hypothetical protein
VVEEVVVQQLLETLEVLVVVEVVVEHRDKDMLVLLQEVEVEVEQVVQAVVEVMVLGQVLVFYLQSQDHLLAEQVGGIMQQEMVLIQQEILEHIPREAVEMVVDMQELLEYNRAPAVVPVS